MAPGTRTEQLLKLLRKKVDAVDYMSPFLGRGFRRLDRLARDILATVSPEGATTGEQLEEALESGPFSSDPSAMEQLALLEASLTRAMEYERLELGISGPELSRSAMSRSLDFGHQVRIVYFFTLGGEQAWKALDDMRLGPSPAPTLDPVCRALRTLRGGDPDRLRPSHRAALLSARHAPLGFCRLLVEEALTLLRASETPNFAPLAYLDQLLDDPFLAVSAPPSFADVRARLRFYMAQHHAFEMRSEEAPQWLHRGVELLDHGTGNPELRALFYEAQGAVAVRRGAIDEALRSFMQANVILAELHMVDRRAESLIQYSLALSAHSRVDTRAALVLESTLAMLVGMAADLHPNLRLRLLHFLALVELRRARGHLPHPVDGLADGFRPSPSDLRRRVTDWSTEVRNSSLGRASVHLRAARDLYPDHAPPLLSLHRSWMLGQALLFEHPDLALIYLLDAQSGFEEAAHLQLAGLVRRDVAACLAYLGRSDQCEVWLETLSQGPPEAKPPEQELLEDLAMLCRGALSESALLLDADEVLGEMLMPTADGPAVTVATPAARRSLAAS